MHWLLCTFPFPYIFLCFISLLHLLQLITLLTTLTMIVRNIVYHFAKLKNVFGSTINRWSNTLIYLTFVASIITLAFGCNRIAVVNWAPTHFN